MKSMINIVLEILYLFILKPDHNRSINKLYPKKFLQKEAIIIDYFMSLEK
jgi:hypothetical protein